MNSLLKLTRLVTQLPVKKCISITHVRQASHWNKDFYPEPVPKTKEDKIRAAEKYGLHPDEYKTYPEDGLGPSDYPKLPFIGNEAKDPYYPWDNPVYRRNYNEPLHWDFDMIGEDRYSAGVKSMNGYKAFAIMFAVFGSFGLLYALSMYYNFRIIHPRAEKQYPGKGKEHYYI